MYHCTNLETDHVPNDQRVPFIKKMINVYQMTRKFIWLIFLASSAMLMILHYLVVAEPLVEYVNMFQ